MIDTPPHSAAEASETARHADVVLPSVEPDLFSLKTVAKRSAGNPKAFCVVNKAPVQGADAENAVDYLKRQGFAGLFDNPALPRCTLPWVKCGQGAAEFQPSSKAAEEALQLYRYTVQLLSS